MTTITFPTLSRVKPNAWSFGQRSSTMIHTSPLSGQVQTVELPGARWTCSMRFNNLQDADRGLLEAFLVKLRGQANRFTLYDFSKPVPTGTMRGTLVTSGSTAAGAVTCSISGGAGQASTTLKAGDKLSINSELKMIVANATANGSGVISVTFEPPLRAAASNGAAVVWDRPTALFIPASPEWVADITRVSLADFALDGVEVFG